MRSRVSMADLRDRYRYLDDDMIRIGVQVLKETEDITSLKLEAIHFLLWVASCVRRIYRWVYSILLTVGMACTPAALYIYTLSSTDNVVDLTLLCVFCLALLLSAYLIVSSDAYLQARAYIEIIRSLREMDQLRRNENEILARMNLAAKLLHKDGSEPESDQ